MSRSISRDLAEVLWKTLDFHRSHSWIKGHYQQGEKYCAVGAFRMANPGMSGLMETEFNKAFMVVANEMFPRTNGRDWESVPDFNDHRNTRKRMVDAVLEKAAIRSDEVLG